MQFSRAGSLVALGIAWLFVAQTAHAHFVWIAGGVCSPDEQVHVYFSEEASPDDPELLKKLEGIKLWEQTSAEAMQELELISGAKSLQTVPSEDAKAWLIAHDYGVLSRGAKSFRLKYYAKCYPSADSATWQAVSTKEVPFEIVPQQEGAQLKLTVAWKGTPMAGVEMAVKQQGADALEGTTDEAGVFVCEPGAGLLSIRAKRVIEKPGTHNGQAFSETRYFATLTLMNPEAPHGGLSVDSPMPTEQPMPVETPMPVEPSTAAEPGSATETPSTETPPADEAATVVPARLDVSHLGEVQLLDPALPALDPKVTSFGAAVCGDWLYVYGGQTGSAHHYSQSGQTGRFARLNLSAPQQWETLPEGPRRTGLALVAHGTSLYRIGGFIAQNSDEEEKSLWSMPDVARFDTETGVWHEMPPLPAGRSSHDAVVIGDRLYVAGGWEMRQGAEPVWQQTPVMMDLSARPLVWTEIATPPWERRALSLGQFQDQLVAIGGMESSDEVTRKIALFDPATNQWRDGPELQGEELDGFGSSAFWCGAKLYVVTASGFVQRLSDDASRWDVVGKLQHPRFFHRLVPQNDQTLVVVGGASMETGKVAELEQIQVRPANSSEGALTPTIP